MLRFVANCGTNKPIQIIDILNQRGMKYKFNKKWEQQQHKFHELRITRVTNGKPRQVDLSAVQCWQNRCLPQRGKI
jgi:hypothetical protein